MYHHHAHSWDYGPGPSSLYAIIATDENGDVLEYQVIADYEKAEMTYTMQAEDNDYHWVRWIDLLTEGLDKAEVLAERTLTCFQCPTCDEATEVEGVMCNLCDPPCARCGEEAAINDDDLCAQCADDYDYEHGYGDYAVGAFPDDPRGLVPFI